MDTFDKKYACAFTGHRPEKLNISESEAKKLLSIAIRNALFAGYKTFITGMAPGIDIWAGEVVLAYKKTYPDLHIVCALPYPTFYRNRSKSEQARYMNILSQSDLRHISFPYSDMRSYQSRNMWMVDNSSLLISAFSGEPGGTKNTVDYAIKQNVTVINILK